MTIDSVQLLARLAGVGGIGAVTGVGGVGSVQRPTPTQGGVPFADMLAQARRGEVSSGLAVSVAPASGVSLEPQQLDRIASAADMAQSAGADRVAVLLDDQTLELDVAARRVLGEVNLKPGTMLANIDAIIRAPEEAAHTLRLQGESAQDDLASLARINNPTLTRVLERTPHATPRNGGSFQSR